METTTGEICCRLCFCSNGNFLNIFNDVPSVFDIAELLKKYFQDEVKLSDPLPNIICSDCWHKTESFHEFHQKVLSERDKYLKLHLDGMVIKMEPESMLVVSDGQFDDFDVNMCVETITVKPMYIDDQDEAYDGHERCLSISSDRDNGIFVTGIDNNKSILDDNLIIKTNQDELYSWSGKEDIKEEDAQNQCNLQFNDTSLFMERVKWRSNAGIFKCDQCDEKLSTRKDLQSHVRAFHPSFICDICQRSYKEMRKLQSHIYRIHQTCASFICDICQKSFKTKVEMKNHILHVHVHVKMNEQCGLCKEKFKTFKELNTHLEAKHPDDLNSIESDVKNISLLDRNDERMKKALETFVDQTCDICGLKLDTLAMARIHYIEKHKRQLGYFKCCKSKHYCETNLVDHLNWHINKNVFTCRLCRNKMFGSRRIIMAHINEHKALQCKKFTCDTCSDIFPRIEDYRSHMETKHGVMIPKQKSSRHESASNSLADPVEEENWDLGLFDMTCDVDGCTAVFTSLSPNRSLSNAREHYLNIHTIPNGYIKCCDMKLKTQIDIKDHIAWHKDPGSFRCKDCGRDYKSGRALSRHAIELHSKASLLHKCGICQKRFKEKAELDAHMMLHEKKPKFSCPEPNCDKSFFKEGYLKFHRERYHHPTTKKKNYICEICGAETFKTFVKLKNHLSSVHKQGPQKPKRKYQCDICLKFYSSQGSLYTHKLTHSSDIHKCTLCEKVSPNAAALVCHMNAVHVEKKLKCTLCDKTFKLAPALKDHIATHLNNKQWKCDYCDLEFYCRPNMYKHRKQVHRIEWEADKARKEAERNKL